MVSRPVAAKSHAAVRLPERQPNLPSVMCSRRGVTDARLHRTIRSAFSQPVTTMQLTRVLLGLALLVGHSATVRAADFSLLSGSAAGFTTTTPTPSIDTYAVPAPSAIPDSKPFAYVNNVQCTDVVANATFQIYSKNRALFDACVVEGKYQIFPYGGTLPTQQQIDSMVRSSSCRSVFTACVLANLPQCDIGGLALKSATETLLKIAIDVLGGEKAPTSEKFYELLLWRRDVNLAQARNLPYDQESQLYSEYSRNLWKALTNTNAKVSPDLSISFDGSGSGSVGDVFAKVSTGSDASAIVAKVAAGDASSAGNFSNNAAIKLPTSRGLPSHDSASAIPVGVGFTALLVASW